MISGTPAPVATIEDEYREKILQICEAYPVGSDERERLKRECWEKYQAQTFERNGNTWIVSRFQGQFAQEFIELLQWRAQGHVDDEAYQAKKIEALRRYAERLFYVGLLMSVFDDDWIRDFAEDSLAEERSLLTPPDPPRLLTDDELCTLCNPLRRFSWRFFAAVHRDFGVGRLAIEPAIFDGVPEQDPPAFP